MQTKPTFQQLITQGYEVQLPLPLPEVPGLRRNRSDLCRRCGIVHSDAVDDISCRHGYQLHPS